jgi:hypothetical protein
LLNLDTVGLGHLQEEFNERGPTVEGASFTAQHVLHPAAPFALGLVFGLLYLFSPKPHQEKVRVLVLLQVRPLPIGISSLW